MTSVVVEVPATRRAEGLAGEPDSWPVDVVEARDERELGAELLTELLAASATAEDWLGHLEHRFGHGGPQRRMRAARSLRHTLAVARNQTHELLQSAPAGGFDV